MGKVGIFSGTFDPVHAGHIAFALEALEKAGLETVYFLPEAAPRRKESVTHYAHRVAMLRLALRPYRNFKILELPDKQFSVNKTLPRLKNLLPGAEIYQLVGSDMLRMLGSAEALQQWPGFQYYLESVHLVVGVRNDMEFDQAEECLKNIQPNGLIIKTDRAGVSSRDIRSALQRGRGHQELLVSLHDYIAKNWLYTAVPITES